MLTAIETGVRTLELREVPDLTPPDDGISDRNLHDPVSPLHGMTFLYKRVVPENNDPDTRLLEVEHHTYNTALELYYFAGHCPLEPVNPGNSVSDGYDTAGFRNIQGFAERKGHLCLYF